MPVLKSKEVIKALGAVGIIPVRQKGSHIQLRGEYKGQIRYTTVPFHPRESLPRGTLEGILEDCGIIKEEFLGMLVKKKQRG